MRLQRTDLVLAGGLALFAPALAAPAAAQEAVPEEAVIYEREVFHYPGVGRADPFRSLLRDGELGVRVEDLTLRGIVHHENPAQSVAILTQEGSDRRIQARVGQRVGALRIAAIHPERVEVVIEELGVARRVTLELEAANRGGSQ